MAFKLVERLIALTEEHGDLSCEFSSSFPLRALVHPGEASGQLLFDGVVWRFESAQSQFRCQIVHRYFTGSIFASKPVPDCGDPAVAQLPNVENNKALRLCSMLLRWRNAWIFVLARASRCLSAISPAFSSFSKLDRTESCRAWQPQEWSCTGLD